LFYDLPLFQVADQYQHKVLSGILGALLMRGIFIGQD